LLPHLVPSCGFLSCEVGIFLHCLGFRAVVKRGCMQKYLNEHQCATVLVLMLVFPQLTWS
jgi:hypothetical protein